MRAASSAGLLQKLLIAGRPQLDLCLLTWASGVMDALSFLRAGVFTANMTGNTVILGLAIAGPGRSRVYSCMIALAAFALGALLAGIALVRLRPGQWARDLKAGLALELPFAAGFSLLWAFSPPQGPFWRESLLTIAAACSLGIQSVSVRRLRISGAVTTFITGTITTAILSFLERRESGALPGTEERSAPLLLGGMWLVYVMAALTGGALGLARNPLASLSALLPIVAVFLRSLLA